jgi:hypothetical protein
MLLMSHMHQLSAHYQGFCIGDQTLGQYLQSNHLVIQDYGQASGPMERLVLMYLTQKT